MHRALTIVKISLLNILHHHHEIDKLRFIYSEVVTSIIYMLSNSTYTARQRNEEQSDILYQEVGREYFLCQFRSAVNILSSKRDTCGACVWRALQ